MLGGSFEYLYKSEHYAFLNSTLSTTHFFAPITMATNGTNGVAHDGAFQKPDHIETRLFINGEFVPAKSGKTFDVYNPQTEKFSASVSEAGVEDVDAAVKAAKDAFPAWSALSAVERAGYLYKLADAMDEIADELAYLDAITMGKTVNFDSKSRPDVLKPTPNLTCTSATPCSTYHASCRRRSSNEPRWRNITQHSGYGQHDVPSALWRRRSCHSLEWSDGHGCNENRPRPRRW